MSLHTINWKKGTWHASADVPLAEIIISADWAPIRDFAPLIADNPESVYGDLLEELRDADLRVTNLESTMTDQGSGVHKSGSVFKGMNQHVSGLSAVPFEIAAMANNHVFDYGLEAFKNTCGLLKEKNIDSTGAGLSKEEAEKPLIKEVKGVKIAFINFSEGEDLTAAVNGPGVFGWEVDRVCEIIKDIKDTVNAVVVICHAGLEYIPFPPPYIARTFRQVADAGADLVIGHHPHVPQGIEIYNGTPICYSLGNFLFFQQTNLKYRKLGYMIKAGISSEGVSSIRVIPYGIGTENLFLLKKKKYESFMNKLQEISEPLKDFSQIEAAWHGFLKYYGLEGFKNEIGGIMAALDEDLPKAAAKFRNRLTTQQHRHHLVDLMSRIMDGSLNDAPEWALKLTELWLTTTIDEQDA